MDSNQHRDPISDCPCCCPGCCCDGLRTFDTIESESCTYASGMSTDQMPTMNDIAAMMQHAADFKANEVHSLSRVCDQRCSQCGRKPIFSGGTLHVCQHVWSAIQSLPRVSLDGHKLPVLGGLRVALFDDGPARF